MKLKRLEAAGIFSFGTEEDRFIFDLDESLTVIVGPNASGKSNVSRVLNLVQTAVRLNVADQEARVALSKILDDHVTSAIHDGTPLGVEVEVRLAIELTSGIEVELMTAFIRSAVLRGLLGNQTADQPALSALEKWVYEYITHEGIESLFEGTIVAAHSGIPGTRWKLAYEFDHNDAHFTWHIETTLTNMSNVIAPRGWVASNPLPTRKTLFQRLTGLDQPTGGTLTPPSMPFSFEALLPQKSDEDDVLTVVGVEMESLNANSAPAPHRAFANAFRTGRPIGDPIDLVRRSHDLASVLSPILDRGLWYLGVAGVSLEMPSGGMALQGSSDRELSSPVPRSDVWMLPSRLNAFKNGRQPDQARYSEIQAMFRELAPGYRFEVRTEWRREASDTPIPFIEIEVFPADSTVDSPVRPRPLRFAGTGVEQALILSETLVGDPDRVLILDEPASNLHPSWQRIVRTHLCSRTGQCILVTHSPYLVPSESTEHLASIVRFSREHGATRINRMSQTDLADQRWTGAIIKELAWSADARGLLFANGVVLVEGETELSALPIWFSKGEVADQQGTPDDLHIAFLSVGSESGFGNFICLLERFGVPWAIVSDGSAFRFDCSSHIFEQMVKADPSNTSLIDWVKEHGLEDKSQADMTVDLFRSMIDRAKEYGVFTLASGWSRRNDTDGDNESFEGFVVSQPSLNEPFAEAKRSAGRSKPRVGRFLAEATPCPTEVNLLYGKILHSLRSKGMYKTASMFEERVQ